MNVLVHSLFNLLTGILANLSLYEIMFLVLGGIIIDIDHLIYMIFREKLHNPKKIWKFHKQEYKINRPHFYIFHFLEIILLLMLISYFINWYLYLIFVGFLLHWIIDVATYIQYYKKTRPWINYCFLFLYLKR
ncbi:hypothetical protein GOV14_00135 [Candidatus Pacearchaeota archaeon]|nr:hypothetical protein [Candidatus Pacearchaeota archaeon]